MGHEGTIYKATNWKNLGPTKGDPVWLDKEGRQVSRKRGPTSRTAAEMRAAGFTNIGRAAKIKFVFQRD